MDGRHVDTEDFAGGLPRLVQDASAIWRCDDEWVVLDLLTDGLTSLQALTDVLAGLGTADVLGLLTVNCEFSLLLRATGGSVRLLLTSPDWVVAEYALGRDVAAIVGGPEEWALLIGHPDLLEDWGIPAADLVRMVAEDADGPAGWRDLPDAIRRRLGVSDLWRAPEP